MATKDVLKEAFAEACEKDVAAVTAGGDVQFKVLETALKAIVERDGINATDAEIKEVVTEGIEQLKKLGKDFSYQNWMMK